MTKYAAFGTALEMGDGATPTELFAEIAQVKTISGPGLKLDTEGVTTHDSTDAWEEVVPTVLRSGEISLDIVYDPADATHDATTGLASKMESKDVVNFKLIFPDTANTTWELAAVVTGFEPDAAVDGMLAASVTLKITGAPTIV